MNFEIVWNGFFGHLTLNVKLTKNQDHINENEARKKKKKPSLDTLKLTATKC